MISGLAKGFPIDCAAVARRTRPTLRFALGALTALLVATQGEAEEPTPGAAPPAPLPIAASAVPARAAAETSALRAAATLIERSALLDEVAAKLVDRRGTIARRLADLRGALGKAASLDRLGEIAWEWRESNRRLEGWADELRSLTGVVEQELRRLETSADVWERTALDLGEQHAPDEITALARSTLEDVRKARDDLGHIRDRALALLGQAARAGEAVQEAMSLIEREREGLLAQLVQRERDPLWSEAIGGPSLRDVASNMRRELGKAFSGVAAVFRAEADRAVFQLLLLILLGVVLRRARARMAKGVEEATLQSPGEVFALERPLSLALLLTLLATPWLYVSTPPALEDLVGILLLVAVIRIVFPLIDASLRPALLGLSALYLVDQLRDLVEGAPVAARLLFIGEMVFAIAIVGWVLHSTRQVVADGSQPLHRWRAAAGFALRGALLVLGVAALAAIAGFVRLGVLLGGGTLKSAPAYPVSSAV